MLASVNGQVDVVELLLERYAVVDDQDSVSACSYVWESASGLSGYVLTLVCLTYSLDGLP